MVKDAEVLREFVEVMQINLLQSFFKLLDPGRTQPRARQHFAQGVDIATERNAAQQGRLDGCRAAAHKRIVNGVASPGQPFDEEFGKLGFETGAIADFMNGMGLTLSRGPEFVDEISDAAFLERDGSRPERIKFPDLIDERSDGSVFYV